MPDTRELELLIRRDDLQSVQWTPAQVTAQAEHTLVTDEVLLRVDRYALTTNNITYARMGQALRYWDFFPAADGWGRMPVWGYADVVASRAPAVEVGTRCYGYLPMSTHVKLLVTDPSAHGFFDGSEQRRGLPRVYQRYLRSQLPTIVAEDARSLFQPLFGTGFLIDNWLREQAQFGARQVLIASASSKTALATAFLLSKRAQRDYEVIGLTSPRNHRFCARVGYYDRVLDYDALRELPATTPSLLIDMSGSSKVLRSVHQYFGAALQRSCLVGSTHGSPDALTSSVIAGASADQAVVALPGPKP
ncbi:MAG: hypothetical protein RL701_4400, partial [Pseudomonadota bacterium]